MRIANDLLDKAVAALQFRADNPKAEGVRGQVFVGVLQMTATVVKKSLAIGDEMLQVANLRAVDSGMADFVIRKNT
jgi:hypothetical protein